MCVNECSWNTALNLGRNQSIWSVTPKGDWLATLAVENQNDQLINRIQFSELVSLKDQQKYFKDSFKYRIRTGLS